MLAAMFDVRSLGTGLFASASLLVAAPAMPDGCTTGPIGGTGGTTQAICGNRLVEGREECDRDDLLQETCARFTGGERDTGTLTCTTDCRLDASGCRPSVCGDGKAEGIEECDGSDLGEHATCHDVFREYAGGQLRCGASCRYDVTRCRSAVCGDGKIEGTEQCEGGNLSGKQCSDFYFADSVAGVPTNYIGTLACRSDDCNFDMSQCVPPPGCYWRIAGRGTRYLYCV